MVLWLTQVDLTFLVNYVFIFMVLGLAMMLRALKFKGWLLSLFIVAILFSVLKTLYLFPNLQPSFNLKSVFTYFFGLLMPAICILAINSLEKAKIPELYNSLYQFACRYLLIAAPIIIIYFALYFFGRINYFGLGVNLHYVTPFIVNSYPKCFALLALVLITGKRAVLFNYIVQSGVFVVRKSIKSPLTLVVAGATAVLFLVASYEYISPLFSRYSDMITAFLVLDKGGSIWDISDTWASVVIFGGRLEEIVGIAAYFSEFPTHLLFGAPPGSNFVWEVGSHGYSA